MCVEGNKEAGCVCVERLGMVCVCVCVCVYVRPYRCCVCVEGNSRIQLLMYLSLL